MEIIDRDNIIGSPLAGDEKEFIIIPENIIMSSDVDLKRVAAYTYFWLWSGKNKKVAYTIESLVDWCGYTPDHKKGRIDEQFTDIVLWLLKLGYISDVNISSKQPYTTLMISTLNSEWYKVNTNSQKFTILYLDEINKIMDYDCGRKSKSLTNSNILAVFSYLRLRIPVRNSTEGESDDRRLAFPEVFYDYYKNISSDIGINEKTLSAIFAILCELNLIHMKRIRRKDKGKWITMPTLFSNTYKRGQGRLIYDGQDYFDYEIENKMNKMNFLSFGKENTKVEDSELCKDVTLL